MANVVEIIIKGQDLSGPAIKNASNATKKLGADMKTLGGASGQLGNVFKNLGAGGLSDFVTSLEHSIISTKSLTSELGKSKAAIFALGVAAVSIGTTIGSFINDAFSLDDVKPLERTMALNKEQQEVQRRLIALKDEDHARNLLAVQDIDKEIVRIQSLQETLGMFGSRIGILGFKEGLKPDEVKALIENLKELKELTKTADLTKALRLQEQVQSERAEGSFRIKEIERLAYEDRIKQINQLAILESDKQKLRELSTTAYEEKLTQLHNDGTLARADLDSKYNQGLIKDYMQVAQIVRQSDIGDLDEKKQLLSTWHDFYIESHRSMFSYAAEGVKTIAGGFSDALVEVAMQTKDAATAFKDLGLSIAKMFLTWILNRQIAFLAEKVLGAIGIGLAQAQAAAVSVIAGGVAAAWAPAATASLIATYGSSASASSLLIPAMIANQTAATGLALAGGVAHGGLNYVPKETTYLLNKGERVISPRQNEDLTNFMAQGGGGTINIDGQRLCTWLHGASRDGRLKIDGRAIV